jgi:translocation protein SEC63
VAGERVVTPSAIVQLTFKCRYIYPSTPVSKELPNGHLIDGPNGHADTEDEKKEDSSNERRDSKETAEDVKDAVVDKAEKLVGQKGKDAAKPVYPSNGYAHAPHWPLVCPS